MIKLISAMKLTKDRMDNPLSLAEINQYLSAYKLTGANTVDVSTVIGHPNYQSYTSLWMNACHDKGLEITLRSAHKNMEGLYGAPKFVGGARVVPQFWIDEAVNALKNLPWKAGDTEAIYPERTEGIFSDSTAFLSISSPNDYANFFLSLHGAIKTAIPSITVGLSANNGSELLSGWMPKTLSDTFGYVVVDHYVDDNPAGYEADIRAMHARYGKPVYVQEGAVSRNAIPTRTQADAYYAVNKKLADEGILGGYGAWGGWFTNNESVINSSFGLTDAGQSLAAWWGATIPEPAPEPPEEVPQPDHVDLLIAINNSRDSIINEINASETLDEARAIVAKARTSALKTALLAIL